MSFPEKEEKKDWHCIHTTKGPEEDTIVTVVMLAKKVASSFVVTLVLHHFISNASKISLQ